LEKIGSGGFGEVYRAWDPGLHRQVALKLVRIDRAAAGWDENAVAEGRLLARIDHPGVARVYGVESHEGRVGIWMEFVEGADLASLLAERGRMDSDEVAAVGRDLCEALRAIHAANVVHKDIKPSNVLRTAEGRLVITDFGAGRPRRIREGQSEALLVGTPAAMAPELLQGEPATPQSDIYALGVLLYQLLTGKPPVQGTVEEILAVHRDGRIPSLQQVRPEVPSPLAAVVERALSPRRFDRFATAAEMGDALGRTLSPSDAEARRRRWPRTVAAVAAALAVAAVATFAIRGLGPAKFEAEATFTRVRDGQRTALDSRDEISAADQLMISLQANRDAYVYILNLDRTGRGTLMFPMQGGGLQNPLSGGERHLLPGEVDGRPFAWTFDTVAGLERFVVVASARRLADFEQMLGDLATVDVGGGVRYATLGEQALQTLLRGVSGAAAVPGAVPGEGAPQRLLEMARRQASDGRSDTWLQEMELVNIGP
jgi:hypothetical protein